MKQRDKPCKVCTLDRYLGIFGKFLTFFNIKFNISFIAYTVGVIEVGLTEDSAGYLTLNGCKSKQLKSSHRKMHESASSASLCNRRSMRYTVEF